MRLFHENLIYSGNSDNIAVSEHAKLKSMASTGHDNVLQGALPNCLDGLSRDYSFCSGPSYYNINRGIRKANLIAKDEPPL